jgi:type I restriction enzyme R subunit
MLPEEKARVKIDKQMRSAGWDIVSRGEYIPKTTSAVKEALMQGNTESDYLLFIDDKAIAVIEAKKEDNPLGPEVEKQAESYAVHPQSWYGLWVDGLIPLVYMANGNKIYFKNMLLPDSDYIELPAMHTPKKMLQIIGKTSEYGALPLLEKKGLRDCQYDAEIALENSLKGGEKKNLAVLATGSGKTYLACLASYRLLNYTSVKRVLFLVDRNNLARQTESEFSLFDKTENQQSLSSLYQIKRLKKENDIKGDVIISTIQKLFAVLTGQSLAEGNEDAEDEITKENEEKYKDGEPAVQLQDKLELPPDYFQFIVVDECHRSIYGKWKAVLDYFKDAKILGLTATPTPEAYAFFNNNIIEQYTYDDSVVDGVNVPARVYRIITDVTAHGGTIDKKSKVVETARRTGEKEIYDAPTDVEYHPLELDRSVVNKDQIRKVLTAYRDSIYSDLYPEREKKWEYIPKTLIFAKDDHHATEIVDMTKEVFGEAFESGKVPEHFVQKITYSSGDSNGLIRDLRVEKDFRIAVTVTLVATGTDVKPLEVVLFMKDVFSETLYTQMKGRGCRVISDDKIKEVTPNAQTKECYYIVDAVGVTEHDKTIPGPGPNPPTGKTMSLEILLEHLSHNELSDENLMLLRNYCASIQRRYEESTLFGRHLDFFISSYGFAPRTIANSINSAFDQGTLVEYTSPSQDNSMRMALIYALMSNLQARKKLLEMQRGYFVETQDDDTLLYAGFSKETARSYIDSFEKYLEDNKDSMEALRIIYNSEDTVITHTMLVELRDRLLAESSLYSAYHIWQNYKILDEEGSVDELDSKGNVNALTNLIQIVRYAYKKNLKLTSLLNGYTQKFSLYCGQQQRVLSEAQKGIMKQIADYIIGDGAITPAELNTVDTDLWRSAIMSFGAPVLTDEMQTLSKFILRAA